MADRNLIAKLAVILHADVVGSTRLVQQDEQLAHSQIQNAFQRFGRTIANYHGRVRELRGDALLAEFERASDAVCAALAFQGEQLRRIANSEDIMQPELRVGIALGEVVIADNTITGQGVVLAQRLEQLAEPGAVCITPAIREALPRRLPFDIESLGKQRLKGFEEAIEASCVSLRAGAALPLPAGADAQPPGVARARKSLAFALLLAAIASLAAASYLALQLRSQTVQETTAVSPEAERPSIAVLPFDNLSGDPEQEYFADGISEDLTTDLSRISGLFVVARNSSFAYKDRSVDLRTVARELGVRFVLEGSVRRMGDQLRINAQLIDGSSGGHVWAQRFDGSMSNVFALQDKVNREIVGALEVELSADDRQRIERVETNNPDAYDLLLRGNEKYNLFTAESTVEARELYLQAATLDPGYARAYANVALTYASSVNFYWADDPEEAIRLGLEYARKAVELDDGIPQIYLTRSILYLSQRQHAAALEAARRTIEVHPNYADGFATFAFIASYAGEYEAGLEALEQSMRLNPQGTGVYLSVKGRILFLMGLYDESLPPLLEATRRNPAFDRNQLNLAATYAELGRLDEARWAVDELLQLNPGLSLRSEREAHLYRNDSDSEHVLEALRKAGLPES